MTALESVMQLKKEGKADADIIATLKAQGVSPMEISDALNQSKIKEAVVDTNPTEGMSPSIMDHGDAKTPIKEAKESPDPEDLYSPEQTATPQVPQSMAQPTPAPEVAPVQADSNQYNPYPAQDDPFADDTAYAPQTDAYEQQEAYAPQDTYYGKEEGYVEQGYGSTDAIIEIAEQVFSEKVKKIAKDIGEMREFKTIFETKIQNIDNRLKRMEQSFDKMQLDIIGKVSEYGKGLDYVKKELQAVGDNFGKVMGKL